MAALSKAALTAEFMTSDFDKRVQRSKAVFWAIPRIRKLIASCDTSALVKKISAMDSPLSCSLFEIHAKEGYRLLKTPQISEFL